MILGRNLISGSFQGVDRISIKYNLKVISSPDKAWNLSSLKHEANFTWNFCVVRHPLNFSPVQGCKNIHPSFRP